MMCGSPHMYARRAAPRLGPHVEMTPWRRGAPASRVRRYGLAPMRYAPTRALRPGAGRARGAHTRRDGARGAVRPVALSPVTAAMVHTHTSRAGRPYSARSFRWGRRPGGRVRAGGSAGGGRATARGERETVRAMCAMCHLNAGYAISISHMADIRAARGGCARAIWISVPRSSRRITDIVGHPVPGRRPSAGRSARAAQRKAGRALKRFPVTL